MRDPDRQPTFAELLMPGERRPGPTTTKPDIISQGQGPAPVRHISVSYQPRSQGGQTNPPPRNP